MIQPTVGRIVLYWPPGSRIKDDPSHPDPQPRAGIIAYVWNDRLINIGFFDQNGVSGDGATSITLLQDGDHAADFYCAYAEWMPYQKGQAAKYDALAEKVGGAS